MCLECDSIHDRVVNAVINVLNKAKQLCTMGTMEIKAYDTIAH